MALNLNRNELNVIFAALNDREGVLAADYERAFNAGSWALVNQIREDLKELRRVAEIVEHENHVAA
jgi:hypothetical protein